MISEKAANCASLRFFIVVVRHKIPFRQKNKLTEKNQNA